MKDKGKIKFIKEQIAFFKAFSKYIEDEKKLGKQPSYDGFLISQAPTLSLTKEKMGKYRDKLKNTSSDNIPDIPYKKIFLDKMKAAVEGFPQSVLSPELPTSYDPQIAPVYRQYLESFVEDSATLDDIRFAADDKSSVIQGLTVSEKFDINPPQKESTPLETQFIQSRLDTITGSKDALKHKDWSREKKKEIHGKDQEIIALNKNIKELEQKLEKLESLWVQFQEPDHDIKIEQELEVLGLSDLSEETYETTKQSKEKEIKSLSHKLKKLQDERSSLQAQFNEVERLMKISVPKTIPKFSETLYSSSSNPIKCVEYRFKGVTSTIKNAALDTSPVCFPAPVVSDYAIVKYKNGAQLRLGQDGKIYIPDISNGFETLSDEDKNKKTKEFSANEEEFVTQLLEKFKARLETNPLATIEIRGIHNYNTHKEGSDVVKARMLKKMVLRYCYDSNGRFDNKKFLDLKFALTKGRSVTDEEIARNPKFAFLQSRSLFQRYVRDDLKRDSTFQPILSKKRKDELLKEPPPIQSPSYYAMKERNASQQNQASINNFFKRRWNAFWSSSDNEKKAKECLQKLVDANKKDLDAIFQSNDNLTAEQLKIQKAKDFLEKYLGIGADALKLEIEKIRKDIPPPAIKSPVII